MLRLVIDVRKSCLLAPGIANLCQEELEIGLRAVGQLLSYNDGERGESRVPFVSEFFVWLCPEVVFACSWNCQFRSRGMWCC